MLLKFMQKEDSNSSAGTNADSDNQPIVTTSASIAENPMLYAAKMSGDDIWSHPMNKDVPQKHKQFFNTVKAYMDSCSVDTNGKQVMDGNEFANLLYALGAKPII